METCYKRHIYLEYHFSELELEKSVKGVGLIQKKVSGIIIYKKKRNQTSLMV